MKIAILSLRSRFGDVTGDCVQAHKTAEALKTIGEDVGRYYLDQSNGLVYGSQNQRLGAWSEVFSSFDVIHAIPPIPSKYIESLPKIKAKLVCSTVFWRSLTYTRVLHINDGRLSLLLLKEYLRNILSFIGIRLLSAYKVYDLLLPNSEDEIRVLRKYAKLKNDAKIIAVPNAIDLIPENINNICRSSLVPKDDYVLVPGFFAARKNQMSLIKALHDFPYPVVFMGKGPMLEKCQRIAGRNMRFLGHIEHGSKEFYSIMKFAKVVCLPSNCETPGIAGLEGAALGARPVVPYEGGTCQYYGWDAEYHNPLEGASLRNAIIVAWDRGRLVDGIADKYKKLTWNICAKMTRDSYRRQ